MHDVFEGFFEWLALYGPKPVRYAITGMLLMLAAALLTIGLWWPR